MPCPCSVGSAGSTSGLSEPACPLWGRSSRIRSAVAYSPVTGRRCHDTMTSEPLPGGGQRNLAHGSTSRSEGSPVSTSATPTPTGLGSRWPASSPDYGAPTGISSPASGPDGSSSRTSPPGPGGCPACGASCMISGMPACRFKCPPVRSALPTLAPGSWWWPTPTAKANHCAPSMRKWPAYARFQEIVGTGGSPSPDLFEWMMGLPAGWTDPDDEPAATPSSPKSPSSSGG